MLLDENRFSAFVLKKLQMRNNVRTFWSKTRIFRNLWYRDWISANILQTRG